MQREYDLFEQLSDGSPMWRDRVSGLPEVRRRLQQLGKMTSNECFAIHLPSKEIVARINVRNPRDRKLLVFQITYDPKLANARAEVLRLHGYEVISAIGNEAAKVLLSLERDCDLFVVGHAAPTQIRHEMVAWLRTNYPRVRIVALNPPEIRELTGVDYNVEIDGPETWVPVIVQAVENQSPH